MKRVVFLDRDGTLNVDRGYVSRAGDWQFTLNAPEAVRRLREAGYAVAVVSNQSGIGRGLYTPDDVEKLHRFVQSELTARGATIDVFVYCPHLSSDQCGCRKPATGLAQQVEAALGAPVDYAHSWTIGDKLSDIQFGRNLGTRTSLLRSPHWLPDDLSTKPDIICDTFASAAERVLESSGRAVAQPTQSNGASVEVSQHSK